MASTQALAAQAARVPPALPGDRSDERGAGWRAWLVLPLLAIAVSWGTWADPLISEDAAILGYVHREGALADWNQSHYGLVTVRFWRPLVTTLWGIQESWTGVAPVPLRLVNLILHGLCAALVLAVALRLGASRLGAWACAVWVLFFPYQGGVVVWPAGRTDSLAALGVLAALLATLRGQRLAAFACALLAGASKESAFIAPLWCLLFTWSRGVGTGAALKASVPAGIGSLLAFLWRRAAVGAWVGGYPDLGLSFTTVLPRVLWSWVRANQLALPFLGACLLLAWLAGTLRGRLVWAALACAILGVVPLFPLLADGLIESQNLRTLYLSDVGLAFAVAALFAGRIRPSLRVLPLCLIFSLGVAWRAYEARRDIGDWSRAARGAGAWITRARDAVGELEVSEDPVLVAGFPRALEGAYALSFGIADRFREPFPVAPRPVWPLRTIFDQPFSERAALLARHGELQLPRRGQDRIGPPLLLVTGPEGAQLSEVQVDERAAIDPDESPLLEIHAPFPGATLELVLYTEMGYEPAVWRVVGEEASLRLSVRQLFLLQNQIVSLGEAWIQTADLGARRAYVEVRALRDGEPIAASEWIPLVWEADVLDILK